MGEVMKLKLMSFNTQHFENYNTKEIEYESVIKLINKYKSDIIGLNEVYGKGFDKKIDGIQSKEIADKLGYYHYFGKSTRLNFKSYGNALLSKYPIIEAKVIKIPKVFFKFHERRSILKAKIDINGNILTVFVTHFGLTKEEQEKGIKTLISLLNEDKFIIMGDFNITYGNKLLDYLKGKTIDTSIYFNEKLLSWPSDNPKYKFDYILTSKDIKIIKADIPNEVISDHRPYITEIEI